MPATASASAAPAAVAVAPQSFRTVLGQVPTSVCVVSATTPQGPVGVTVGSFTSVSLDPPLVVFYGGATSASTEAVVAAGRFRVNVLAEAQQEICAAFASRTGDRFATGDWEFPGDGEPPVLAGAVAWIDCDVQASFPAGDHRAVLGHVRTLAASPDAPKPLVFHRGRLVRLDRACGVDVPTRSFSWWDA
ncbi:flavin reductase family protein [Streptomyces albidoflavus]